MMLHRAWLELRKLANRIHHRSRGNLLVVERARALPAMQPQQLLVSWDLLEELAYSDYSLVRIAARRGFQPTLAAGAKVGQSNLLVQW